MQNQTKDTNGNKKIRIDKDTFETIYQMYWEKVYAVCYNNIREIEPAREMVQDIFKSVWERRHELELENVNNYLIRSAKFKTFEYIRNKVSQQQHICIKYQDCTHSSNCTEEKVLFNNLKEKVDILVDTLPCQCRRVYKMSREQGLSNKEIAAALLISERAVEYHITKALSVLRVNLSNYSS
ncbi:MAG: RNA polymerase sigma-70 factor [Pedobacter sp.]|uniref:RNA polymerase sigma-70 factor n=1 Tax=Pedobacter sp. TaxID=1411316 RepID=UPI003562AB5E